MKLYGYDWISLPLVYTQVQSLLRLTVLAAFEGEVDDLVDSVEKERRQCKVLLSQT